jgi:hypothetical protein
MLSMGHHPTQYMSQSRNGLFTTAKVGKYWAAITVGIDCSICLSESILTQQIGWSGNASDISLGGAQFKSQLRH